VPGSRVSFLQTDLRGIALVQVPLITAALDVGSAAQRDAAKIVFEDGEVPADASRFPLHPAILPLADLVNGTIVLEGLMERSVSLTVRAPDRAPITIPAALRSIGDEMGYVLRCGLYLTFSAARRKDKEFVHEFDYGIAVKNVEALSKVPDEVEFLKALRDGAQIMSGDRSGVPIDHWGYLRYLGPDLERFEKSMAHVSLPIDELRLADVVAIPFMIGTGILAAFMDGYGIDQICPGFIFEEPLNGAEPDETHWRPCSFEVPIVMNLGKSGLIVWSSGAGSVYVAHGVICGFRPERQVKWWFEKRDSRFSEIDAPQLWLYKDWPGVPLGGTGKQAATYRGGELPFAGTLTYRFDGSEPDERVE